MTTNSYYERIRFETPEGRKTVILKEVAESVFADEPVVTGIEVDMEGSNVGTLEVRERQHIIAISTIVKRTPMVMTLKYALLEVACM